MRLYGYWRSTTSYRVRIALHLKSLAFDTHGVNLVAGEQFSDDYRALNPGQGVPCLVLDDGAVLTQSLAILRYLESTAPTPALWPRDPVAAARVEAASLVIATDIHPVNNLRVGQHLKDMGHSQEEVVAWMNHWMRNGLLAFQHLLDGSSTFCFGETPTLADVCLIPQLYNVHRWGTDLSGLDKLLAIEQRCLSLPAFAQAHPDRQPDAM